MPSKKKISPVSSRARLPNSPFPSKHHCNSFRFLISGVVLTHSNLHHQVSSLCKAWEITSKDVILHTLPLHHMHGIMNALLCPLYVGAKLVY